jgi:hypothetical protein
LIKILFLVQCTVDSIRSQEDHWTWGYFLKRRTQRKDYVDAYVKYLCGDKVRNKVIKYQNPI